MAILRRIVTAPRPPAEYSPQHAASDALKIAQSRGLKLRPLDVLGLASSIGLQIEYLPLAGDVSGFLKRRGGDWVIGINSLHHPNRQRFTIAHEMGHYFLHRDHDFVDKALFRRDVQNDHREADANRFASALLMPREMFRDMVTRRLPMKAVAEYFGVSEAAAQFRSDSLGEERMFG